MNETRQLAHELIDRLPELQLLSLVRFLETIVDPVVVALRNAPIEDEEISQQEDQGVADAREWLKRNRGKGIPHTEAMRKLGLE